MFKLFLVDDKINIVKGIRQMADWEAHQIKVAGSASNGKEALKLICENVPDIIIADIYMPIMDGLVLSREVLRKWPATKIILLSGYDRFEYAQEAVELGVFKYLLKPVGIEKIVEAVCQARDALIEMQKTQEIKNYFLEIKDSGKLAASRGELLRRLMSGEEDFSEEYFFARFEDVGIKTDTTGFAVVVVSFDSIEGRPAVSGCPGMPGKTGKACRQIEEITLKEFPCAAYMEKERDIVVIINTGDGDENWADGCIKKLARLYQKCLGVDLKAQVSIGIGKWYRNIRDIRQSYREAYMALSCRFTMGPGKVISINGVLSGKSQMDKEIFDYVKRLINFLESHSVNEMDRCIEELISYLGRFRILMPHILKGVFHNIISVIHWEFTNDNAFLYDYFKDVNLYGSIKDANCYEELKKNFRDMMHLILEALVLEKQLSSDDAVKIARKYILNHLSEDLSLEKVSSVVHLHPVYFTRIFKQKEGRSFSEFVKHARMEKAKELLINGEDRIFSVAEKVGFADRRYFSDVFKSVTGMTPSEYKEKYALRIGDEINTWDVI